MIEKKKRRDNQLEIKMIAWQVDREIRMIMKVRPAKDR